MGNYDELIKAKELLDKGVITEEEFSTIKKQLLDSNNNYQANSSGQGATDNSATQNVYSTQQYSQPEVNMEPATTGIKVLSFLIPLAGLIMFIVDKDKKPNAAKDELMWAGIGFGVGLVLIMCMGGI